MAIQHDAKHHDIMKNDHRIPLDAEIHIRLAVILYVDEEKSKEYRKQK